MLRSLNYKVFNQSINLHLGIIEDEDLLKELKNGFRRILFESEPFLLKESREKTVGINPKYEGVGTALYQEDDEWVLNFGFGRMDMENIQETLSLFEPLRKILANFQGDTVVSFVYVLEDFAGQEKANNAFLKEMVLSPEGLVEDELQRLCKMRRMQGGMVYTLDSVKKNSLSLEDSIDLLQKEKNSMERIFIPSLHNWLNFIKRPDSIKNERRNEIDCSSITLQSRVVN